LDQRIQHSETWLRQLLTVVLQQWFAPISLARKGIQRVLLRDASSVGRRGSQGTEMRLHLTWDLLRGQPVTLSVTDEHGGEELGNAGLQAQDLVIGDRAYGVWQQIRKVWAACAYFLLRMTWSNCPLCTLEGEVFDVIAWLENLPATQKLAEVTVSIAADPQQRTLRLVAGRLPPEAAARAQERARRTARKKKRAVLPQTLIAAQFCLVLTNLPATTWASRTILALYRIRWQIEWCFRRWKSLCHLDALPAYPATIATPVFLAKVLLILLLQYQLDAFLNVDCWTTDTSPVLSTVVQLTYCHMFALLCPVTALQKCLTNPQLIQRHLRTSRHKQALQMQTAMKLLNKLVTHYPCPNSA